MTDEQLTQGDITRFEKNAKRLGYQKKPKKMTAFEVFAVICFLSYLGSLLILWSAWFVKSVQPRVIDGVLVSDQFFFSWVTFAETIQQSCIFFTQYVLGKVLNVLNQHFNPQKLLDELIEGHEAAENLAQQVNVNNNPFPQSPVVAPKPTPTPAPVPVPEVKK